VRRARRPRVPARRRGARRHAPRLRRPRGAAPHARRRPRDAGAVPHRARRRRGPGRGAHRGRRRLRHEALQPRGARRAPAWAAAPLGDGGRAAGLRARRGRPRARRGQPRGPPRRRPRRAHRHRVRAAALPHAQPQARALQGPDPRPGVELRLRRPVQRRRALHLLPAQEDRRRALTDDPHRAGRGVRAQAGGVVLRARSLRTRLVALTLVLLAVAAVVIGLVTALAVRHSLISRLDADLASISNGPGRNRPPPDTLGEGPQGGGPPDLITVSVTDGQVTDARVRTRGGSDRAFPQSDLPPMVAVPPGVRPMTVDLPTLGQYRVVATTRLDGDVQVTGLPEAQLQQTVTNLVTTEL